MAETTLPGPDRMVGGRYRLAGELGRGGMGVVWLADDTLIGRQVAVKELRTPDGMTAADREAFTQRALAEARNAARVHHPGTVTLHDVIPAAPGEDDSVYLVMELVRAPTLADVIASHGPLDQASAAGIGLQLLDVLDAAHALGVVHRDVKPTNIMIERGGRARLADFGIAQGLDDPRLTRTGIMGTQAYLAPELFGQAPVSPAADLWSLGATLYHAVAGSGPFDRDTTAAVLAAILVDDLPAPPCPPPLATAITALLTRDPGRRATGRQLRSILQDAATPAAEAGAAPVQAAWEQQFTTHTPRRPGQQTPRMPDRPSLMDPARAVQLLEQATQAACREQNTIVATLSPELRCLSHIDPARAELIAREAEPTEFGRLLTTKLDGGSRARLLAATADGLVRRDPGQADRILTEAEHLAPVRYPITAGIALAEVAGLRGVFDTDGALRLVSEVERLIGSVRGSRLARSFARYTLMYALAGIDPARAESLAHEMGGPPDARVLRLVRIADRLARSDPGRAGTVLSEALQHLSSVRQKAWRQRTLADIAGRLAFVDIGRAEQTAAGITDPFERARALAEIATVLAPSDRSRALGHLEHSKQIVGSLPARFRNSFNRVRLLAVIARGLGPLDPGRAQGLIASADMLLADIRDDGKRGIASYYLAACGSGIVLVNEVTLGGGWFTA